MKKEIMMTMCVVFMATRNGAMAEPAYDGVVRDAGDGSQVAYMQPPYKSNHASTLEKLPGGGLIAAWFSGEREEASGCAIVVSRLEVGSMKWTAPITVSKREGYSNQNPVLYYSSETKLTHLYHSQAKAKSGESKAQIYHLQSGDNGKTWSSPEPWLTNPGSFPRNRIIPSADGEGLIFPFYYAGNSIKKFHDENYSIMGLGKNQTSASSSAGWKLLPVAGSADLVQPTVVRREGKLIVFFRDRRAEHVYSAESEDDGVTWSMPSPTVLPNNNAGIEAYTLKNSSIVMAFNPQTKGRDPLAVGISHDGGVTWPQQRYLQHGTSGGSENGNEFSYPTILQTDDGTIHCLFTYLRQTIKYKRFSASWISGGNVTY